MSLPTWLTGITAAQAGQLAVWLQRLSLDINAMHSQAVDELMPLIGGEADRDAFYLAAGRGVGIHKVHDHVLDVVEALYTHARAESEEAGR